MASPALREVTSLARKFGSISQDKRFIALVKSKTTSDSDIFLHDRMRGTTKKITAHKGTVSDTPPAPKLVTRFDELEIQGSLALLAEPYACHTNPPR